MMSHYCESTIHKLIGIVIARHFIVFLGFVDVFREIISFSLLVLIKKYISMLSKKRSI